MSDNPKRFRRREDELREIEVHGTIGDCRGGEEG
ncbi:hypothetical protein COLO4_38287 [Corchorus olitorius]|uniref:Uncharacterized protein n=1 Tax=Corchorus olitorius TaxID=93759 RepID=A0A1R3FVR0_9ROSI|nr:hypothetical protein COLO4_38287 [Corchorus olitorius]